ncbi:hypothetical protein F8M41_013323 [Gigaspora margarita]|uniref:Uncharacterized protein n=1 Tax=Gigaspora margarita TaxID=4874 RepID=A0A8H4ASD1_GIGMA|nr:hypothetical protein F8M41_013323 [Gigaspora margarita]
MYKIGVQGQTPGNSLSQYQKRLKANAKEFTQRYSRANFKNTESKTPENSPYNIEDIQEQTLHSAESTQGQMLKNLPHNAKGV